MLDVIYSFVFDPIKTIQLNTHRKQWGAWWTIILISAIIASIKLSGLTLVSIAAHSVILIFGFGLATVIIDLSAQAMGANTKLKTVFYWLPFIHIIFWLLPSITMIQNTFVTMGSLLVFGLNIIYIGYLINMLKTVYEFNFIRIAGIFIIPIIAVLVLLISFVFYGAQLVQSIS